MKHIYILFFTLLLILPLHSQDQANEPATEIRAAWLTTNWKLDWPKGKTVSDQKRELQIILDELQQQKFNVILFQVRALGKVFYNSSIEGKSPFFNSSDGFDPLAFVIEECHTREMECHAWIATFPVEHVAKARKGVKRETKPSYYKSFQGSWFLDPGRPETTDRLVQIANEIVSKYDVDGLHLDYIRYPDKANKFPDDDTFKKYGRGKNKNEWRRQNVNNVVSAIYDAVKAQKKWVQVSSAPLGKYKSLKSNHGWTAYETVFQDAVHWLNNNKHDILFPMMYYDGDHFYPYADQWFSLANGKPIVPGLGVYRLEENEGNWDKQTIIDQMQYARDKGSEGLAYYRVEQIMMNKKGIRDAIAHLHKYPAKLPPLTWLEDSIPQQPINFQVFKDKEGQLILQWEPPTKDSKYTYNIYFATKDQLQANDASGLLIANLHKNSYSFTPSVGEFGLYYFVTASDRYHNESESVESVFFVHSENIY